jgi:hypothetical protein
LRYTHHIVITDPIFVVDGILSVAVMPVASDALEVMVTLDPSEHSTAHPIWSIDVGTPAGAGVNLNCGEFPGAMGSRAI